MTERTETQNVEQTKESGSLQSAVDALVSELHRLATREHRLNDEDCWYSCPVTGECCNDGAGDECNCGAVEHNKKIEAVYAELLNLIAR